MFRLFCCVVSAATALSPAVERVAACVRRTQASLDEATAAKARSAVESPTFAVASLDTPSGAAAFRDALAARRHAVLLVDALPGEDDFEAVSRRVGPARDLKGAVVGTFADDKATFVDLRFDAAGRAVPADSAALDALGVALRAVANAALDAVLGDDDCCFAERRFVDSEALSSSVLRRCRYAPSRGNGFNPHTDTTFFTVVPTSDDVPGLELFDPSLGAWVGPEAASLESTRGRRVVVMAGEFLDLLTDGAIGPAVHRVTAPAGPRPRLSTVLLLRADHSRDWCPGLPMARVWRALAFSNSPDKAVATLLEEAPAPAEAR